VAADEATTVLALSKAKKVQHHSFQSKCKKRNNLKVPFAAEGLEGFGTIFRAGYFLGRFSRGARMANSSSEPNELESNKSSAWAEAWVALLPPVEVEDVFSCNLYVCGRSFLSNAKPR
jgi:hypothetical protein